MSAILTAAQKVENARITLISSVVLVVPKAPFTSCCYNQRAKSGTEKQE